VIFCHDTSVLNYFFTYLVQIFDESALSVNKPTVTDL